MSTGPYFIGCLHLGHDNMARYRGFKDAWEQDEYLVKQWNKRIHNKDLVYILGDITMETSKHYYKLDQLNGRKKVVLGNHDRLQDVAELLKYVESVAGAVDYKDFILTHVPIHPNEVHFYRGNIHAHIHHNNKLEEVIVHDSYNDVDSKLAPSLHKYYNVDALLLNFTPKTIEEILL